MTRTFFIAVALLVAYSLCLFAAENASADTKKPRDEKPIQSGSVTSPLGLKTIAAMLYAGAAGETADEIKKAFDFSAEPSDVLKELKSTTSLQNENDSSKFSVSNAIWIDNRFKPKNSFKKKIEDNAGAAVFSVDILDQAEMVAIQINNWAKDRTNGNISSLLDKLDANSKLVLTNAIFFKGSWATPFSEAKTDEQSFSDLAGTTSSVKMMNQTSRMLYGCDNDVAFIELPYASGTNSMMFIMPKDADKFAWEKIDRLITNDKVNAYAENGVLEQVECSIPKFTISTDIDLRPVFQAMGVKTPFNESANFAAISDNRELYVSKIVQKIEIEVNESGSVASTASAAVMSPKSVIDPNKIEKKIFKADRPFFFVVRNTDSKEIIFSGKYTGPDNKP